MSIHIRIRVCIGDVSQAGGAPAGGVLQEALRSHCHAGPRVRLGDELRETCMNHKKARMLQQPDDLEVVTAWVALPEHIQASAANVRLVNLLHMVVETPTVAADRPTTPPPRTVMRGRLIPLGGVAAAPCIVPSPAPPPPDAAQVAVRPLWFRCRRAAVRGLAPAPGSCVQWGSAEHVGSLVAAPACAHGNTCISCKWRSLHTSNCGANSQCAFELPSAVNSEAQLRTWFWDATWAGRSANIRMMHATVWISGGLQSLCCTPSFTLPALSERPSRCALLSESVASPNTDAACQTSS